MHNIHMVKPCLFLQLSGMRGSLSLPTSQQGLVWTETVNNTCINSYEKIKEHRKTTSTMSHHLELQLSHSLYRMHLYATTLAQIKELHMKIIYTRFLILAFKNAMHRPSGVLFTARGQPGRPLLLLRYPPFLSKCLHKTHKE